MPRAATRSTYPLLDLIEAARSRLVPPRAAPWLMLLPALLLTGLLLAGLALIADSSLRVLDRDTFRLGEAWSLANYAELLRQPAYLRIALRTTAAAAIVTVLTLVLAFPYAYLMVRTASPAARKLLLAALFLPFFLGQVVRAYGWLILLGKQGLLNAALGGVGLPAVQLIYTYPGVLLGLVQYMLPFAVLLLAPALTAIPEEVELASASLGGTGLATLRHVLLPLARPGLAAAGVVVFTLTLTDFAIPEIMGGGGNDFVANATYDAFFQLSDAGAGGAMGVMLTLLGTLLAGVVLTALGLGTLAYVARDDRA
jgi:putative spermidine/putrescine transport system permease protein